MERPGLGPGRSLSGSCVKDESVTWGREDDGEGKDLGFKKELMILWLKCEMG